MRGFVTQVVCSQRFAAHATTGACDYWAIYRRTPGVEVLRLTLRLHRYASGGTSRTCTLSIAVGTTVAGVASASYVGGTPAALDGSTAVPLPYAGIRQRETISANIDVSGLSTSSYYVIRLRYTPAVNGESNGVESFSLVESPRSTSDVQGAASTEPGFEDIWPDVRNRMHAGTTGASTGLLRIASEYDIARTQHRRHLQIALPSQHYASRNATTEGALGWGGAIGATWDPTFVTRCRKLWLATGNNYRFLAIYAFNPAWADFTNSYLRAQHDSTPWSGATTGGTYLPLTNTGALTTFVLGSVANHGLGVDSTVTAPTNTATFQAITADNPVTTSSEVRVLAFALIEEET